MATGHKRGGKNPLAYMGVDPIAPTPLYIQTRAPLTSDLAGYTLGSMWVVTSPQEVWVLVSKALGVATWIQLYPGAGGGASSFPCDVGTANEAGGVLDVKGGVSGNIITTGAGNVVTTELNNTVTITGDFISTSGGVSVRDNIVTTVGGLDIADDSVIHGRMTAETFTTTIGFQYDNGHAETGILCAQPVLTKDDIVGLGFGNAGQVLIGKNGALNPTWANITSTGGSITITNGAGTINLESSGSVPGGGITGQFLGNIGGVANWYDISAADASIDVDTTTSPGSLLLSVPGGGIAASKTTVFTSSGTWTKDIRTKTVSFYGWNGGGGGGSAPVAHGIPGYWTGGGGGSTGGLSEIMVSETAFGATELVTIGAGGAGGAGATSNTIGNAGANGGVTSFGPFYGYNGATGGQPGRFNAASGTSTHGSYNSMYITMNGSDGASGTQNSIQPGGDSYYFNAAAGGAGASATYQGGGLPFLYSPGSDGGSVYAGDEITVIVAGGHVVFPGTGANGNPGNITGLGRICGGSGGAGAKGANNIGYSHTTGGNGGFPGGGGGGSMQSGIPSPSSPGGNGGNGALVVIEYF